MSKAAIWRFIVLHGKQGCASSIPLGVLVRVANLNSAGRCRIQSEVGEYPTRSCPACNTISRQIVDQRGRAR